MKYFDYEYATSYDEAVSLLKGSNKGEKAVLAGGTDLIGVLKAKLLPEYPEELIDLKTIPDADSIIKEGNSVEVGALAKLADIEKNNLIKNSYNALAEAARSVASPLIRNQATIGGNICQDVRCWFYRYPNNVGGRLECMRKGGAECYAIKGENRNHSVFGGMKAHLTPCSFTCPAGTDIPGYMEQLRAGDWDAAARIFMQYNPMPFITSRICPHPCQDACNQGCDGDCVNIHAVERSLGDYVLENMDKYYKAPEQETGKKAAVVGAGPGGLAAAFYLRTAGNEVVVIDRMEKAGGVLRYGIPHYRLSKDLIDKYVEALEKMGVKFQLKTEIGKDVQLDKLYADYDTVYLGTGAWKAPVLGLEGETLTQFGLNFLVEVNTYLKGAIGNEVLVCGGGNVAMDVALTACRLGAKKVKLVCLEKEEEMPAQDEEIAMAKEEGVEIYNGWGLDKVVTDAEGKVCGLQAKECVSVFDENHRFSPVYGDKSMVIESDCIILATGQRVDIDFLGEFADQMKTARGLIKADDVTGETNKEGVYAGGDAVTGPNIAIRAIAAGRKAAASMNKAMDAPAYPVFQKEQFITYDNEGVLVKEKHELEEAPLGQRTLVDEDCKSLSKKDAIEEAKRCMNCGCYSVNASDISPVLTMYNADIVTTKKTIKAKDFFTTELKAYDMLDADEVVKSIKIDELKGYTTGYYKFRVRNSIDFAITSCAYAIKVEGGKIADAKLVLGGVAPIPKEIPEVEAYLIGKTPDEKTAEKAAEIAVKGASPLAFNSYKVQEIKAAIKEILAGIA
ncbi:MAG: FAD-dependent oxidoreductase [Lachnospiraceae bacterium]